MTRLNVFGAGRFARDVARALVARGDEVEAFLTSGPPAVDELDGRPWRQVTAAALAAAPLWIGVFNHQASSDYGRLDHALRAQCPEARLHWPQAWYHQLAVSLGWRYWLHAPHDYAALAASWPAVRAGYDDDASRQLFDDIVRFRSEAPHAAKPPAPSPEPQYLPAWLRERLRARGDNELRLVDGGAYRGETVRELAGLMPLASAWAFEPDATNHAALLSAVADLPVTCLPTGLSDADAMLPFQGGAGAASSLAMDHASSGFGTVHVQPLDDALGGEAVNLIKLDVEGHEAQALAGARETIRRCRPVLAIAAYHRWDDLWRLPALIDEIQPGYRLRLQVHQHNSFDTVLYAF